MTLTPSSCNYIVILSDILNDYISNPGDYSSVVMTGKYNEGTEHTNTLGTLNASTGAVRTVSDEERIYPEYYDITDSTFSNGVYSVEITATKTDSTVVTDSGCVFMDCDIYCQVNNMRELILHYPLKQLGSAECSCDCVQAYKIYQALLAELKNTTNESDCGC